jgi:phage-related protein
VWHTISTDATHIVGGIAHALNISWNSIVNVAKTVLNGAKSAMGKVWTTIVNDSGTIIGVIGSHLQQVWTGITDVARNVLNGTGSTLGHIWSTVSGDAAKAGTAVMNAFIGAWGPKGMNFGNAVLQPLSQVVQAVTGAIGGALHQAGTLVGDAYQWGYNIISNFASGIGGAVQQVANVVGQIANAIVNYLRGHSPTKLGPLSTPLEFNYISEGIQRQIPLVQAANQKIASTIKGAYGPGSMGSIGLPSGQPVPMGAAGALLAGGAGQGAVIVNLTLQGGVFTDPASLRKLGDQLSGQIMSKLRGQGTLRSQI